MFLLANDLSQIQYIPLMLVLQTPYRGQKALPELASITILYPTFRVPGF